MQQALNCDDRLLIWAILPTSATIRTHKLIKGEVILAATRSAPMTFEILSRQSYLETHRNNATISRIFHLDQTHWYLTLATNGLRYPIFSVLDITQMLIDFCSSPILHGRSNTWSSVLLCNSYCCVQLQQLFFVSERIHFGAQES